MKHADYMPSLELYVIDLLCRAVERRVEHAVTSALAVTPLREPSDVERATDAALAIFRAQPQEQVEPWEHLKAREPRDVHELGARFFVDTLAAQDRDVMRARVLQAIEAGANVVTTWPAGLAPCIEAIRQARAVAAGAGDASRMMATSQADALFLDCYDQALPKG